MKLLSKQALWPSFGKLIVSCVISENSVRDNWNSAVGIAWMSEPTLSGRVRRDKRFSFAFILLNRSNQTVYHHVLGFCDNRNNNCLFSLINFDNLWLCTTLQHLHQYLNLMKIKPRQSNQFLQAFGTNNRKYSWNIIQTYITTINLFLSCA